ncbi:SGS-domain-containing protein [Xylaria sp. CBS 124048]|nr:SGS-domain-containing protein [Xylaria sp. CBS 124048]
MSSTLASAGVKAVSEGRYVEGIEKLTKALKDKDAPLWYIERSKAYLRTEQTDRALCDAEMALRIAYDRANRNQMVQAQLRRAITFFRMGRFADADVCAFWTIRLAEGALANEQDGQLLKVDENGDYTPRKTDIGELDKSKPTDGLSTVANFDGSQNHTKSLLAQASTWRWQALSRMEELPAGHIGRKIHLSAKYPEISQVRKAIQAAPSVVSPSDSGDVTSAAAAAAAAAAPVSPANATSTRHNWNTLLQQYHRMYMARRIPSSFYQTETSLTIDIFLKNLSKEHVTIDCKANAIKLSLSRVATVGDLPGSILIVLFDKIKPEAIQCNVKSMKIELVLQKQTPGKWPTFRRDNTIFVDNLAFIDPKVGITLDQFLSFVTTLGYQDPAELKLPNTIDIDPIAWYAAFLATLQSKAWDDWLPKLSTTPDVQPPTAPLSANAMEIDDSMEKTGSSESVTSQKPKGAPAYPTSSKTGPKDWDSIDDDDGENPAERDVNSFFRDIYKGADDDTKRAMMKSYIESNGTALSTNWNEAREKTYQTSAPDGAEAKKWE